MYQDGSIMWSKPFWCRTLFTIYYSMDFFSYSTFFQAKCIYIRYRPRFFDQVGHQTTYASMGNNYQHSRQKLGTILENKVL